MHGFGSLDRSSHRQQEIDLSTIYSVEPVTLMEKVWQLQGSEVSFEDE
tara:strand:+ start:149 stop:292 length:144 start_codon:yes stop_codon:yes gene_type:complete